MKFTCDSCSAQYMISDEKVGPSGVKVRCKKCGTVIVVRRAAEAAARGATAPAASGSAPGPGLDAELGSAFDHAFGDAPQQAPAGPGPDLGDTQAMGSDDAAKVFASAGGAPAATEWYVAIGQAQVGPLPLVEVKKKWEAGDIGPDSLVWRPGMADWSPLTTVSELAGYLAPVPRPAPQPGRAHEPEKVAARAEPQQPAAEVSWKPIGASALAALASEEIATRAAPEPRAAARPAAGVRSLVDALPDGGGVDPTGALPLNLKALEATTGEKKIERRSSVARGVEQARRRSTTRAVATGVAVGVLLVAGAGAAAVYVYPNYRDLLRRQPAAPSAAAPPSAAPPSEPAVAAPPPQPAPQAAVAAAPPAVTPTSTAAPPAATAPSAEATPAPTPAPARRETRREAARREREATRVAAAPPREETPPPPPSPTRKKGGDLLDFESNDAALDAALGGGSSPSGRTVYVPPARASALPDKVSPGDINGAVAQRMDSLRRCVSEQKAREPDATGTLKMRWIIQADGSPHDVKCITPEYAKGAFAQCIVGVLRTVQFPRSTTKGQEVTFPFNF
jgi:predicted Zn finger-like uncharacterized protein